MALDSSAPRIPLARGCAMVCVALRIVGRRCVAVVRCCSCCSGDRRADESDECADAWIQSEMTPMRGLAREACMEHGGVIREPCIE